MYAIVHLYSLRHNPELAALYDLSLYMLLDSLPIARSTKCSIHVRSTDQHLIRYIHRTVRKQPRGSIGTARTQCREPRYLIRKWNTIQNLPKWSPLRIAIEPNNHHIHTQILHK